MEKITYGKLINLLIKVGLLPQRQILTSQLIARVNLTSHRHLSRWRLQDGGKNRASDSALLAVQPVQWFLNKRLRGRY